MKIADLHTSAVSLVKEALEKAKKYASHNIFISLNEDEALKKAAEIDQKIQNGEKVGRLAGVPYALKDNFLSKQGNTTAASKILSNLRSPIDSTTVAKLEAEGAIMIGRTNLDAFAHGSSTENSFFGPTHNAKDFERVAGGSSGGSAAAVALDIVPFATGTDTGGSIRQPASFNGVYGFKPTYGLSSRYGAVAMASSTDTMGCFARHADDVALVTSVMAGRDDKDMTTLPDYFEMQKSAGERLRVGLISEAMSDGVDAEVCANVNDFADKLRAAGHAVEDVDMPSLKYALAIYYIVVPAEVSSNLARYDGVRYGYRAEGVQTLAELYGRSRNEGFMTENKRRIMIGSYVLSSGFFDAYYLKAQKARTVLINEFNKLFEKYDFLLLPTAPTPAFGLGENTSDPVKMYLADVMTVPPSLAGLPAISIPAGSSSSGLPIGAQLVGPMKSDAKLIALAGDMEGKNE